MIKILTDNLYRFFGVFVNSPKKEIEANKEKILTSIREKKPISFKLDLEGIMPPVVERKYVKAVDLCYSTISSIDPSDYTLEQQFWFVIKTPTDILAFRHLFNGNINSAIATWEKDKNMSSLQNLFVCYLIKEDYKTAILDCAIPLYEQYVNDIDYINILVTRRIKDKKYFLYGLLISVLNGHTDLTTIAKESKNELFRVVLLDKILDKKIEVLSTAPKEVLQETKDIAILVSEFDKQKDNIEGYTLLEKAQKPLISIKEKLGKENNFYINTSTILAYTADNPKMEEVRKRFQEIKESNYLERDKKLRQYLSSEWKTLSYIDLLDIDPLYRKRTFQSWRQSISSKVDEVDPNIKSSINIDRKFFWADSEYFASCGNIEDYRKYLSLFPSGNHVAEANTRINSLIEEKRNKDSLIYLIIAILVAIIIFFFIFI